MERLKRFTFDDLSQILHQTKGEIKLGERVQLISSPENWVEELKNSSAKYVLLGIPEDIGVRANTGKSGARSIWQHTLNNLLNLQHNRFCKGYSLLVLGYLDVSAELNVASDLDSTDKDQRKTYYKLVEQIDKEVSHLVFTILKANKIPVIIGGGQNNSYGAIKGAALSIGKPINAVNFDAFSHFTITEGRHSGNSFSYAFEEGFLQNYFIFGLHENYTSKAVLSNIKKKADRVKYNTYEQLLVRCEKDFFTEIDLALQFIQNGGYGIDVDLDAMTILSSNNLFSSGFKAHELRQFVSAMASKKQVKYFHISEGSSSVAEFSNFDQVGKLIALLITDFIKSNMVAQELLEL